MKSARTLNSGIAPALLLAAATALSGCVSAKYKLAKPDQMPPPIPINLSVVATPLEATVNTVVIYHGPGSWKREAYWDEYVVTLANRGSAPLTIDSASLGGIARTVSTPGADPWALERQSRALQREDFGVARDVAVQLGGGLATVVGSAAAGAGTFALIYGSAFAAPLAGAVIVGAVALPAFIGGSVYANVSSRREVEREFARRRFALPITLVPNQVIQGSLFFPITPGPQRLTFGYRVADQQGAANLDLAPLSSLHLKAPPTAVASTAAEPPNGQP